MINNLVFVRVVSRCKMSFCNCHPHSHCQSLSKGTCCGFHTLSMSKFGVTRSHTAQLAELFQLVHGHFFIPAQVKQAVEEHRAMSGRKNKTVPVEPLRIRRVET